MKESLRKPLLFAVIVVIGSVLVLFDISLIILLPLILIVGFGTLLALGSLTIAEIKTAIAGLNRTKPKEQTKQHENGILKRLGSIKLFQKKTAGTKKIPSPIPEKKVVKKEVTAGSEAKSGFTTHISTFIASIGSLGSVLRQKSRQGNKVEDINKLLDKTVSEKVSAPSPVSTPTVKSVGGGSTSPNKAPDMDDPFMSLSGDEFDEGLLDGLGDDDGMTTSPLAMDTAGGLPDTTAAGPDLPPPTLDISSAAGDILKNAGGDLEEFDGLDGGDLSDADLGDLDNLSLDDVDLNGDLGDTPDAAPDAPTPSPDAPAATPAADSNAMKTAWIPSDAPKEAGQAEDEVSTQADMAAFASGSSTDDDMLSSLASDVKHVKKEKDLSLMRELKDFKAPAAEIENELNDIYGYMGQTLSSRKKETPATKEIK
jgi:hypothetical protein